MSLKYENQSGKKFTTGTHWNYSVLLRKVCTLCLGNFLSHRSTAFWVTALGVVLPRRRGAGSVAAAARAGFGDGTA